MTKFAIIHKDEIDITEECITENPTSCIIFSTLKYTSMRE